jgi:hypothetical protein
MKQCLWPISVAVAATALLIPGPLAHADSIAVGINLGDSSEDIAHGATDIGWVFVPSSTFTLTGISTQFAFVDGRTVTAELRSVPDSPNGTIPSEVVGSVLRSSNFVASTSISSTTPQAAFAPITLTAGTQYFIDFLGIAGLGHLTTGDPGATHLGVPGFSERVFYDENSSASFSNIEDNTTGSAPILALFTGQSVPEPSSVILLGSGFFTLVGYAAIRRRSAMTRSTLAAG